MVDASLRLPFLSPQPFPLPPPPHHPPLSSVLVLGTGLAPWAFRIFCKGMNCCCHDLRIVGSKTMENTIFQDPVFLFLSFVLAHHFWFVLIWLSVTWQYFVYNDRMVEDVQIVFIWIEHQNITINTSNGWVFCDMRPSFMVDFSWECGALWWKMRSQKFSEFSVHRLWGLESSYFTALSTAFIGKLGKMISLPGISYRW